MPQDLATYGGRIADYIERRTNLLAGEIRDAIDNASWIPESLKPPHQPTSSFSIRAPPPPQAWYHKAISIATTYQTTIAVVVAFASTTAYLAHRRRRAHARKRRVKRLPNGSKKEIVVLVCPSLNDPLTRSLALDLERRGYVVYVTVGTTEEDSLVQREARPDLRSLWFDVSASVPNPAYDIHPDLEPIRRLLCSPSNPVSPSRHRRASTATSGRELELTLAGIVVFPGLTNHPVGPLNLLRSSSLVDTLNTRLIGPVVATQHFLSLLMRHSTDPASPSSIVLAYPSIPASLSPPSEVASTIVSTSLSSLAATLRREVSASAANITIHELKLGNFDLGPATTYHRSHNPRYTEPASVTSKDGELVRWRNFNPSSIIHSTSKKIHNNAVIKGSSAREFHNAVFDALAPPPTFRAFNRFNWQIPKRNSTHFVGSGARIYDICGTWLPAGLVGLLMGYTPLRRPHVPTWKVMADRDEVIVKEHNLRSQQAESVSHNEFGEERIWGGGSTSLSEAGEGQFTPESGEEAQGESTIWERV